MYKTKDIREGTGLVLSIAYKISKRPPAKSVHRTAVAFSKSKECRRQSLQIKMGMVDMDHPQRRWLSFDIKAHGGIIIAESKINSETQFTISIFKTNIGVKKQT